MKSTSLNVLRIFAVVASHQNMRSAADELHLTPSAVAQRIRRLESELGTSLFTRRPRGLVLTDQGKTYYQSVRAGLAIIDEATRTLTAQAQHVVISVPPSFGVKWLLPRMDAIQAAFPDIELRMTATEALSSFGPSGADFVIRFASAPFAQGLQAEHLASVALCAVASPAYLRAHSAVQCLSDLSQHRLIDDAHRHWEKLIHHAGFKAANKVLRFEQTSLAIDAALAGQGVCIAPRILVQAHVEKDELRRLHDIHFPDEKGFYLVYPEGRDFDPNKRAVFEWFKAQITPDLTQGDSHVKREENPP